MNVKIIHFTRHIPYCPFSPSQKYLRYKYPDERRKIKQQRSVCHSSHFKYFWNTFERLQSKVYHPYILNIFINQYAYTLKVKTIKIVCLFLMFIACLLVNPVNTSQIINTPKKTKLNTIFLR